MWKRKRRDDEGVDTDVAGAVQDPSGQRLGPIDVQQRVFRLAFRGYNERDVDEFLDEVTENLAALYEENKRLRERVDAGGGGHGSIADAERRAEEIVRQAREHAARLVAGSGSGAGEPGPPAPPSYLAREREFLTRLATLIQEHAENLRREARIRPADGPSVNEGSDSEPEAVPEDPEREGLDWENPFVAAEGNKGPDDRPSQEGPQSASPTGPEAEEDPSLRQLFWGDD